MLLGRDDYSDHGQCNGCSGCNGLCDAEVEGPGFDGSGPGKLGDHVFYEADRPHDLVRINMGLPREITYLTSFCGRQPDPYNPIPQLKGLAIIGYPVRVRIWPSRSAFALGLCSSIADLPSLF